MLATHPFYSPYIFSCAVKYYGEAEFWFALIKVTTVREYDEHHARYTSLHELTILGRSLV